MNIKDSFVEALSALWTKLATFVPNLAGGLFILLVGYLVSRLVSRLGGRLARKLGIDRAGENAGVKSMLHATGVSIAPSEIIARTIFLFSMLVFVLTAADTLGLGAVSSTIDSFILFLPKVLAALVIALLGLFFAQLLRDAIRRMTEGMGVEYASALATAAHGLTVVVVLTLAVSQLEVETALLHVIIAITLAVAGLAAAIALGLGTQHVAQNIVSGVYARDVLEPGMKISWKGTDGVIVEVGSVSTVIDTKSGRRLHVPNGDLMGQVFETAPD